MLRLFSENGQGTSWRGGKTTEGRKQSASGGYAAVILSAQLSSRRAVDPGGTRLQSLA